MVKISLWAISFYQKYLSPYLGSNCRFYPTCSNYAYESFCRFSFGKALWKSFRRVLKCHPFHHGGYDPLR